MAKKERCLSVTTQSPENKTKAEVQRRKQARDNFIAMQKKKK